MSKENETITINFRAFVEFAKKSAYLELLADAATGKVPCDDVIAAVGAKLREHEEPKPAASAGETDGADATDATVEIAPATDGAKADGEPDGKPDGKPDEKPNEAPEPETANAAGGGAGGPEAGTGTTVADAGAAEKPKADGGAQERWRAPGKKPDAKRLVNRSMLEKPDVVEIETSDGGAKKRRRIDVGKIKALEAAGWSRAAIADEMNMTALAVAQALYRDRKKAEAAAAKEDAP